MQQRDSSGREPAAYLTPVVSCRLSATTLASAVAGHIHRWSATVSPRRDRVTPAGSARNASSWAKNQAVVVHRSGVRFGDGEPHVRQRVLPRQTCARPPDGDWRRRRPRAACASDPRAEHHVGEAMRARSARGRCHPLDVARDTVLPSEATPHSICARGAQATRPCCASTPGARRRLVLRLGLASS